MASVSNKESCQEVRPIWSGGVALVVALVLVACFSACGGPGGSASGSDGTDIPTYIEARASALRSQVLLRSSLDFDGDGKSDIIWRNDDGTIAIWLMDGATPKSSPVVGTMSASLRIVGLGDFDGDGKSDILWQNDNGAVLIWLMNGATPKSSPAVGMMSASWKIARTGDFDGDGKSDILWRNDDGTISIWLMDGATPKTTPVVGKMSAAWKIAHVGDFDGDSKSDILWRNDDGTISIWLMSGATPKTTPVVGTMPSAWKIAHTGDFDGDGRSDILWRNDDGTIAIWLMNGATPVAMPVVGTMNAVWNIVTTGDFDGDGKSDIVWRHNDGTTAVWLMSGATPKASPVVGVMSLSWKLVDMASAATAQASPGNALVLQAGDYWEFEWTETTITFAQGSGTSTDSKSGIFRVTLGTPQVLGGKAAFPVSISGNANIKPIWTYLAADGPALLGTLEGVAYSTILGGEAGGWKGSGFFTFYPPDLAKVATRGTFKGNYRTTDAWVVSRSSSSGGCTYYSEVGQNICTNDPSSYSESEYQKAGVGPIGYAFSSSSSYSGGGFYSSYQIAKKIELIRSSRIANDGTVFGGPPWDSLPTLGQKPNPTGAAALNGSVLTFGGNWTAGNVPPWVQAFDPNKNAWGTALSSGAEARTVIGISGGSLYALGRTSALASTSLLRMDPASNIWHPVRSTVPSFSNVCGAASLASGNLAVVDCHPTSIQGLTMYIYNAATGRWATGVRAFTVLLRAAVAAVGDDVYVISGYSSSSGAITGNVRRFRSQTNAWEWGSDVPTPRDGPSAVSIGNKVYVMGGTGKTSDVPSGRVVEIFDASSGTWSTGPMLPQVGSSFAATTLDGDIYVFGNTAVVYSP